jgi:hypothetical protein
VWSFTTGGTAIDASIPGGIGPKAAAAPAPGQPPGAAYNLLWRHDTAGWLATWQMNGITMTGASALSINQVADLEWTIGGTGDLNGDGHEDIVWRNEKTGALAAWFLQNTTVTSNAYLSISPVTDLTWKLRGVGDTNGDGLADLVWQNASDGRLAVWFMSGAQVIQTSMLSIPRVPNTSWKVRASGDTNGDGRSDLIWQNASSGELAVWFLNGPAVIGTGYLSVRFVRDTDWRIVGAHDVNGDRRADILWQHADGSLATWFLDGQYLIGNFMLNPSGVTNPAWEVAGPK